MFFLLLYMDKLPVKKSEDDNKAFHGKYKKFFLVMAIALSVTCVWIITRSAVVWARLHDHAVVAVRDISRMERFFRDYGLSLPPAADPVSALVRRGGSAFEVAAFDVDEADFRAFLEKADGKYRLTVPDEAGRETLLSQMAAAFAAAGVPFLSEAGRERCQAAETWICDCSVCFVSVPDAGKVFMVIVYDGALPE